MGKNRNSFFGGPMNVGAYRNYPYWAAPRVWGHFIKAGVITFIAGALTMLLLVQKNPDLQELRNNPKPAVTVTHTHIIDRTPK